jgi:hemerythrin superfamily protein
VARLLLREAFIMHQLRTMPTSAAIRDRMIADHERLESLLQAVLEAFEANDRERVAATWSEFDKTLLAHMNVEEKYLVPLLLKTKQRAAFAILREHGMIRDRLLELGAGVDLHIVKLDMVRTFIDELRAHARHEDRVLYSWADEHMGDAGRTSLAAIIDAAITGAHRLLKT